MAVVQGNIADDGPADGWLVMTVRLPRVARLDRGRTQERQLLIGAIDRWLRRHHRAVRLPDAEDGRRGDVVAVAFRTTDAETGLAWRVFCGELGLSPSLTQTRVLPNRCPRTTPP